MNKSEIKTWFKKTYGQKISFDKITVHFYTDYNRIIRKDIPKIHIKVYSFDRMIGQFDGYKNSSDFFRGAEIHFNWEFGLPNPRKP